jgi:hypothetical protein
MGTTDASSQQKTTQTADGRYYRTSPRKHDTIMLGSSVFHSLMARTVGVRAFALALTALTILPLLLSGCSLTHHHLPLSTGQVAGHIYFLTTGSGVPVREALGDAKVNVAGTRVSAVSSTDGTYLLSEVPSGVQTLEVSRVGYRSTSQVVNVAETGISTAPDITLTIAPYKWAVLVYLDADNNLESYGVLNVNQMEMVPASTQVVTAVQMDRNAGYDSTNGNWSGCRRFTIQHDSDTPAMILNNTATMTSSESSPYLDDLGPTDMGSPATLRAFVDWGTRTFPAEHYLLVLWDHGSGWKPRALSTVPTRYICMDDTSYSHLLITDIPDAIRTTPPIDIVACDACMMQGVEMSYELKDVCNYLVGSEENVPAEGYPYHKWLTPLVQDPTMMPAQLGKTLAQQTYLEYESSWPDITHSVIDESTMEPLATAVKTFAQALAASGDSYRLTIGPKQVTLRTNTQQQFIANPPADVIWSASKGSISTSGFYIAPSVAGTYTITGKSSSGTASATVTVSADTSLALSPVLVTMDAKRQQQFTAIPSADVMWTTTGGSITTGGLFTAPTTSGMYTVTATSPTAIATATVWVNLPSTTARNTADYYSDYTYKDLYDYATIIENSEVSTTLKTAAQGVKTALDNAVLVNYAGSGHAGSHGLSIYVPAPLSYTTSWADSYAVLPWATASGWGTWLGAQPQ